MGACARGGALALYDDGHDTVVVGTTADNPSITTTRFQSSYSIITSFTVGGVQLRVLS